LEVQFTTGHSWRRWRHRLDSDRSAWLSRSSHFRLSDVSPPPTSPSPGVRTHYLLVNNPNQSLHCGPDEGEDGAGGGGRGRARRGEGHLQDGRPLGAHPRRAARRHHPAARPQPATRRLIRCLSYSSISLVLIPFAQTMFNASFPLFVLRQVLLGISLLRGELRECPQSGTKSDVGCLRALFSDDAKASWCIRSHQGFFPHPNQPKPSLSSARFHTRHSFRRSM
jgi:hypothetical protein